MINGRMEQLAPKAHDFAAAIALEDVPYEVSMQFIEVCTEAVKTVCEDFGMVAISRSVTYATSQYRLKNLLGEFTMLPGAFKEKLTTKKSKDLFMELRSAFTVLKGRLDDPERAPEAEYVRHDIVRAGTDLIKECGEWLVGAEVAACNDKGRTLRPMTGWNEDNTTWHADAVGDFKLLLERAKTTIMKKENATRNSKLQLLPKRPTRMKSHVPLH